MTPGSSNSSTTISTTSDAGPQGIAISVTVESQAGVFGARTTYAHIPGGRSSVSSSSSGSQESPPKRRKIDKATDLSTSSKTVKAMQQYGFREMQEINQTLMNHLTRSILSNTQKQAKPEKQPSAAPDSGAVSEATKALLLRHIQASTEKNARPSDDPPREKLKEPTQSLPKQQPVHGQAKFTSGPGPGDREVRQQLQAMCENISDEAVKLCGVHIAPARFYQLFEVTPDRLLGFIKSTIIKRGNQFISPDVLRMLTPQQVQYLKDIASRVYQAGRTHFYSSRDLLEHMVDIVHDMPPPPKSVTGGLYDVLSYYTKELKVRGGECSTDQLKEFFRQNADRQRIGRWLAGLTFNRKITEQELTDLFDLLEMADRHCRFYRYYKSQFAKTRQKPAEPEARALLVQSASVPQPSTDKTGQPPESEENISAGIPKETLAHQQPNDESSVSAMQVENEDKSSLVSEPETEQNTPSADLAPVYLTNLPIFRKYPGIPNSGNYCYMICAVQFLRATIPEKQQQALITRWRQKQKHEQVKKPDDMVLPKTVTDSFSALLSIMSEGREKSLSTVEYRRHQKKTGEIFRHFATVCLQHESLCTEIKGELRYKKDLAYIKSLEQNDAQGFLMKLQQELGLNHQSVLNFYEQLELNVAGQHFSKPQIHSGATPILMLPLARDGDIQKSLDAFLESELACRWTPEELAGAENLPAQGAEGYQTRQVTEIKANPSQLVGFTLCLKNTEGKMFRGQFKDQKMTEACDASIDDVFKKIRLPVTDPETEKKHRLIAQPVFIIFHNGQNYQSGHYLTLRLQGAGWMLNDDDHPAVILPEPVKYLRHNNAYPYLIEYRIVGSEPA